MTGDGRRVSVDFWRGFALLTIFINHIPGNVAGNFTYRNFGISDAAELFVLLAGISAAFAYLRPFERGARVRATARIWLRAFQLYVAHLALLLVAVAVVGGFVVMTGDERVLEWYHLDIISQQPIEALVGMALLSYQPAYLNILPLYVAILLLAPVLILLMRMSIGLGLAASGALYLATQLTGISPTVWPNSGTWFFNPFAWQFLFACGLAIGRLIDTNAPPVANRVLDVLAPAYLAATLAWAMAGLPMPADLYPLPAFLWDLDKTNLAVPRLLHVLALVYCVSRLPLEALFRSSPAAQPLIVLGRHALPVFCLGTVLALALQIQRAVYDGGVVSDLLIVGAGGAIQWMLAWALEWYRTGSKAASGRSATAA